MKIKPKLSENAKFDLELRRLAGGNPLLALADMPAFHIAAPCVICNDNCGTGQSYCDRCCFYIQEFTANPTQPTQPTLRYKLNILRNACTTPQQWKSVGGYEKRAFMLGIRHAPLELRQRIFDYVWWLLLEA